VVEVAADRITVEVPKDFGHDKRYTIHRVTRRMPRGLTPWRKLTLNDANNAQRQY
jgi:hypothetical protein